MHDQTDRMLLRTAVGDLRGQAFRVPLVYQFQAGGILQNLRQLSYYVGCTTRTYLQQMLVGCHRTHRLQD